MEILASMISVQDFSSGSQQFFDCHEIVFYGLNCISEISFLGWEGDEGRTRNSILTAPMTAVITTIVSTYSGIACMIECNRWSSGQTWFTVKNCRLI